MRLKFLFFFGLACAAATEIGDVNYYDDYDPLEYPTYDFSSKIIEMGLKKQDESQNMDDMPVLPGVIFSQIPYDSKEDKNLEDQVNEENKNDEREEMESLAKFHQVDGDIDDGNVSLIEKKEQPAKDENFEDSFTDYQIEDNRSDEKDESLGVKDNLPNDDDSIKDSVDMDLENFPPEFNENIEDVDVPPQIIEEAKKLLEEENSSNEEDIEDKDLVLSKMDNDSDSSKVIPDIFEDEFDQESLVQKYINDMIEAEDTDAIDLNNPEQDENNEDDTIETVNDENAESLENEDENDEDTVDKVYQDLNADLENLFATWKNLTENDSKLTAEETNLSIEEYEEKYDRPYKEGVILNQRDNFNPESYDNVVDSILDEAEKNPDKQNNIINLNLYLSHEEEDSSMDEDEIQTNQESSIENEGVAKEMTKNEYTMLMNNFSIHHKNELATDKSVLPNFLSLIDLNQSIEITSPNYPDPYSANDIKEWIILGNDRVQGIEINITDLNLRGAQGDYLLINPGTEFNGEGLVFSYELPNETILRQYRFTSVNNIFVRFYAGAGLNFLPGFRLTVKPIRSSVFDEDEDLPASPEPLLPSPSATLTVNLGFISDQSYDGTVEDWETFRRIVADMATMYINANGIEPGSESTLEVTQITNIATCNLNWPNFERCVAVTFAVPLVYDDVIGDPENQRLNQDDLINMWTTSVNQDPFRARLRLFGVTEFSVPDDARMMTMWAVLGVGMVVAAGILGVTLWRFSCFRGYSRMTELDDKDSLSRKRGLDLYPTPHQPLPPLYTDNDYKWADSKYDDTTRVDMGGFANKSYARDELLEIDSDEENIQARDRYTTDV